MTRGAWSWRSRARRSSDFLARLRYDAPPLASIEALTFEPVPEVGETGFSIRGSVGGRPDAAIAPDTATCDDCLAELFDPADRRYRYPFINCTNCGPRFTIVTGVPYDRPNTTMAGFVMCAACQAEYDDPADRRFHAQPNACPECGPTVTLEGDAATWAGPGGAVARTAAAHPTDAVATAPPRAALRGGAIVGGQGCRRVPPRVSRR